MTSITNLTQVGLVNIEYPPSLRGAVEQAVASWRSFCLLPEGVKTHFVYKDDGNADGTGYELKQEKGRAKDLKENFHVTLGAMTNLKATAGATGDKTVPAFIADAETIIREATPLIKGFVSNIENQFGVAGLAEEVIAGQNNWFLRYLHYFGDRNPGEEIASAHADKCGFTLHLYESDGGLQYLELAPTRAWREMPVAEGQTAIIPSMQLQYRSGGKLKALCHRVVATEQTAKKGRYSMVCFVPFMKTPKFNKVSVGRMQEFAPGFNYDMPGSEFEKLFA